MSKPVEHYKEGNVSIAIFENTGPRGQFRTAAQPQCRYKKDGEWKDSNSYGVTDLENLEKVAKLAREHIVKFKNDQKADNAPEAA
jgi:hypothetical protein